MSLILPYLALLVGLFILTKSSNAFVDGASATAQILGINPVIIGITIIGFGTSAPEIIVAFLAAVSGNANLAIGNAIGSNIANIALILGAGAILYVLNFSFALAKREMILLLFTQFVAFFLLIDLRLTFFDTTIMFVLLVFILVWMIIDAKKNTRKKRMQQDYGDKIPNNLSIFKALLLTFVSLLFLLLSAKILVWGAVEIARFWGVSELVIGLSIVAVGTSLPELAATISSASKKRYDLIIGNVIGSNMFNTLAVLPVPALITDVVLSQNVVFRDIILSIVLTIILLSVLLLQKGQVNRIVGFCLFFIYVSYQVYIFTVP
jgi:cation:H+ antiporter